MKARQVCVLRYHNTSQFYFSLLPHTHTHTQAHVFALALRTIYKHWRYLPLQYIFPSSGFSSEGQRHRHTHIHTGLLCLNLVVSLISCHWTLSACCLFHCNNSFSSNQVLEIEFWVAVVVHSAVWYLAKMYLQLIEVSSAGKVGGYGNKLQCIQKHTHCKSRCLQCWNLDREIFFKWFWQYEKFVCLKSSVWRLQWRKCSGLSLLLWVIVDSSTGTYYFCSSLFLPLLWQKK